MASLFIAPFLDFVIFALDVPFIGPDLGMYYYFLPPFNLGIFLQYLCLQIFKRPMTRLLLHFSHCISISVLLNDFSR